MTLDAIALLTAVASVALAAYAYLGYPSILWGMARLRRTAPSMRSATPTGAEDGDARPSITIVVIAHNEADNIRGTIERLLELDYPADRRQILVVSDASDDGTDVIVAEYAARGVELVRIETRGGKTRGENLTLGRLRGDIIVNTDAAVRVRRDALGPLLAPFADPSVGLTSGRDVSTSSAFDESNAGEGAYVRFEMWVRRLETATGGIIGASGCLFAIRRHLHLVDVPTDSLRDFAAPLIVHAAGYRAISVDDAICFVPRTARLRSEYCRKVRTYARGMHTLLGLARTLDPRRGAMFAWKLASHKLARWLLPWAIAATVAMAFVAGDSIVRLAITVAAFKAAAIVGIALRWPVGRTVPAAVALGAAAIVHNVGVLHATWQVLRGDRTPVWEPTRRSLPSATGVS